MGCRPDDLVINCFNYSVYAGGVMDHMSFETLGASILAYGVGKTRELLGLLADLPGSKCLYSTPSYAIRLVEVATQSGINPLDLKLNKGFFSGEAGLQIPGYRNRIESTWAMSSHDLYGVAELGCQSAECEYREGMHFCGTGLVIAELVDSDNGVVKPMTDGETGELVFTSIKREASPMIRLRTHDFVQVFTEPCRCGRSSFRFRTLGRSDDMFIVKGVNIFPTGIQDIITQLQPQLTGEFQIVLDKPPPFDYSPRLLVEVANDFPQQKYPELMLEVEHKIKRQAGFGVLVELVKQGTIASEHKTRRVLRPYENIH
ncbi:MAG: hypothetical protein GKR95_20160 [Gammaproteobacteria bacterium]|nr:hypothetical protein [Gammaproteobacteria bacterium]